LLLSSSGYEALLQKATEYHILLDFHGANKPTGRLRTWPNELVREAIRGIESSALRERARHETILPFTRYLAGPADYTAMLFNVYNGPYGRIQGAAVLLFAQEHLVRQQRWQGGGWSGSQRQYAVHFVPLVHPVIAAIMDIVLPWDGQGAALHRAALFVGLSAGSATERLRFPSTCAAVTTHFP